MRLILKEEMIEVKAVVSRTKISVDVYDENKRLDGKTIFINDDVINFDDTQSISFFVPKIEYSSNKTETIVHKIIKMSFDTSIHVSYDYKNKKIQNILVTIPKIRAVQIKNLDYGLLDVLFKESSKRLYLPTVDMCFCPNDPEVFVDVVFDDFDLETIKHELFNIRDKKYIVTRIDSRLDESLSNISINFNKAPYLEKIIFDSYLLEELGISVYEVMIYSGKILETYEVDN